MKKIIIALLIFIGFSPFIALAIQITVPSSTQYGQVLIGNASGGSYTPVATSTLGISGGGSGVATTSLLATYPIKATVTSASVTYSLLNMGTTTASCSGATSCSSFVIIGTSPVTISSSNSSSTLLIDNNTFSASTTFQSKTNMQSASSTNFSATNIWDTGQTASRLLALDNNNMVIASSSVGVNNLTGILPQSNGGTGTTAPDTVWSGVTGIPKEHTFIDVTVSTSTSGTTQLYKVPNGDVAFVSLIGVNDITSTAQNTQLLINSQFISSILSIGSNSFSSGLPTQGAGFALYAGQSLNASSSASVATVYTAKITLFTANTGNFMTASTTVSNANTLTTLYSASGHTYTNGDITSPTAFPNGTTLVPLVCFNGGAGSQNTAAYITPSGGTPLQVSATTSIGTDAATGYNVPVDLASGDTLSIITAGTSIYCYESLVQDE